MAGEREMTDASQFAEKPRMHLVARDNEDLTVLSALMQDSLFKATDIAFDKQRRLFAMIGNRYCWELDADAAQMRARAGMHFSSVRDIRQRGFVRDTKQILSLLAIAFEPSEKPDDLPGGEVSLTFSAGVEIRLTVEALDVVMQDVSGRWPVAKRPKHDAQSQDESAAHKKD
jgi:hypothetical protein